MRLSVFIFVMQILAAAVLLAGVLPPGASAGFAVPPRTQFELERAIRDLRGSSDIRWDEYNELVNFAGILASCELFGTQRAIGYLEQSEIEKLLGEEFGVPLSSDYHLGAFWDYVPNARDNDASSVHEHVLDGFVKRWNASRAFVNGNVRVRGGAPMTSALQWMREARRFGCSVEPSCQRSSLPAGFPYTDQPDPYLVIVCVFGVGVQTLIEEGLMNLWPIPIKTLPPVAPALSIDTAVVNTPPLAWTSAFGDQSRPLYDLFVRQVVKSSDLLGTVYQPNEAWERLLVGAGSEADRLLGCESERLDREGFRRAVADRIRPNFDQPGRLYVLMEALELQGDRVYALKTLSTDRIDRRPEVKVEQQGAPHRELLDAVRSALAQSAPLYLDVVYSIGCAHLNFCTNVAFPSELGRRGNYFVVACAFTAV